MLSLIKSKLSLVVAGLLLGLILLLGTVFNLYRDAAASEAAGLVVIESLGATLAARESSLRTAERLLESKELQRKKALSEANAWRVKWREVKQNDPECKDWAARELPVCVTNQLLDTAEDANKDSDRSSHGAIVTNP